MTLVEAGSLKADRVEYTGDATTSPSLLLERTQDFRAQTGTAMFLREIKQIEKEKTKG